MKNRARLLLLAALPLAALAAAPLRAQPGQYGEMKLPHRLAWGAYNVVVEKTGPDDFDPERAKISDERGQPVQTLEDQRIINVGLQEITAGGSPELYVHTYSGGAHCCSMEYYFTRDGGFRNLLAFDAGNGGIMGVKDLNRDGRPEIIAANDALAYFGGISYAGSPQLVLVIGWSGTKYVDQTRKYPDRSRGLMRKYQGEFLQARNRREDIAEEQRRSAAAGVYANALSIGEGAAARQWVMTRIKGTDRTWFLQHEGKLRAAVTASVKKIGAVGAKTLKSKGGC